MSTFAVTQPKSFLGHRSSNSYFWSTSALSLNSMDNSILCQDIFIDSLFHIIQQMALARVGTMGSTCEKPA